jgi:hypothetical protein
VVRSITQASPGDGSPDLKATATGPSAGPDLKLGPLQLGLALVTLCLVLFMTSHPQRDNVYKHFILQSQAWLDGGTAIPDPGYQDVMPILDADGNETGQVLIPFPPLPALVLLPFVALWHASTNQQLLSAELGAVDVGIAYWMLGYLPLRPGIRWLTALFLGLGTVLWYASAIGSTWFFAHVVAVGCLLLAIGLALSADREAAEPEPLSRAVAALRRPPWPGGVATLLMLGVLGALVAVLFKLAGDGAAPAALAVVGLLLGVAVAGLALVVSGRRGVVAPLVAFAGAGGLTAALLLAARYQVVGTLAVSIALGALMLLAVLARRAPDHLHRAAAMCTDAFGSPEARQVAAGILFGLAVNARLTIIFGLPFFVLVGGGGSWLRRGLLAGAGVAIPVAALLVYTYTATGHLFNPAYDYIYESEIGSYGQLFGYHAGWSIEDLRYIPQNVQTFLFGLPDFNPTSYSIYPNAGGDPLCVDHATRGIFDRACPIAMPNAVGMSVFLTSPAYFLAPLALLPLRRLEIGRATAGAAIAVGAIAFVNLMHFSQGWVQFGYRFSNDFAPFALILVALGASRINRLWPLVALVAASMAINFWGVTWGVALGW